MEKTKVDENEKFDDESEMDFGANETRSDYNDGSLIREIN